MKKKLKLFVWENVLVDYSSGVMFALAHDAVEAREKILEAAEDWETRRVIADLLQEPKVVESPEGFLLFGGG